MVLSTDMKYHFEITQKFKTEIEKHGFDKENRTAGKQGERSINGADPTEVNFILKITNEASFFRI